MKSCDYRHVLILYDPVRGDCPLCEAAREISRLTLERDARRYTIDCLEDEIESLKQSTSEEAHRLHIIITDLESKLSSNEVSGDANPH